MKFSQSTLDAVIRGEGEASNAGNHPRQSPCSRPPHQEPAPSPARWNGGNVLSAGMNPFVPSQPQVLSSGFAAVPSSPSLVRFNPFAGVHPADPSSFARPPLQQPNLQARHLDSAPTYHPQASGFTFGFGSPSPCRSTDSLQKGDKMDIEVQKIPHGTRSYGELVEIIEALHDPNTKKPPKMSNRCWNVVQQSSCLKVDSDKVSLMDFPLEVEVEGDLIEMCGRYKNKQALVPWNDAGKTHMAEIFAAFVVWKQDSDDAVVTYAAASQFIRMVFFTNAKQLLKDAFFQEQLSCYLAKFGESAKDGSEWVDKFNDLIETVKALHEDAENAGKSDETGKLISTLVQNGHEKDMEHLKKDVLDKEKDKLQAQKDLLFMKYVLGKRRHSDSSDVASVSEQEKKPAYISDGQDERASKKRKF